ncbi:MAG: aldehyde dehydrogenase [Flavisolibacter sp.]
MTDPLLLQLGKLRQYFTEGHTKSFHYRKEQIEKLRKAIVMHENALYDALYKDLGKNREESWVTEIGFLLSEIRFTLRNLRKWMKRQKVGTNFINFPSRSFIYKEPRGVVLIIGPWNYPLQLLFTPLLGALAAGNCVVLKPSEFAPETAKIMEQIIQQTFPENYILFVQGEGSQVLPQMMNDFNFDHVFYTGSTEVGKIIYQMAAKKLVPVTLELGGKSPCIIEKDANLKVAARRIASTKFSNAGQLCIAPDYVLVHETVKQQFIQHLKEALINFYSTAAEKSYSYGKVVNRKQFSRLLGYLKQGDIVYGGRYHAEFLFLEPTILENVSVETEVMKEEIFGPILPIIPFSSFEQAKAIIDRNSEPLAFYLFTKNRATEKLWIEELQFGGGCINNASWHFTNPHLPFGGRGKSGMGTYHGKYSFDVFTHQKAIMKTPTWFDPNLKYPSFQGKLPFFKKIIR